MTRWTRLTLCLVGAVLTGISCQNDNSGGPTDPGAAEAEPALATTMTAPLAFLQVNAGMFHTCGVATDHRAYCWGWNVFGQVGNGTNSYDRRTPALVAGGLRFRQISAGSYNTCGVTTDYRAYCWGRGTLRPAAVPGGHLFRQVSAGEDHICGVTTDDRAYCWGINTAGQLGDGTVDFSGNYHPMPVAVGGGLRFREVSTAVYHSCGVTTTDRAFCWGGNQDGQVGDGSKVIIRTRPVLVAGGLRFRQVETGGGHGPGEDAVGDDGGRTCGVTTDDRAFCWGNGNHGQNGNGTQSIRLTPTLVAGGLHFLRVSAGIHHTCGQTTSNRAYCWGAGLVGDGTTTQRLTPAAVAGGLYFRQVSAGGYHTCSTTPGNVAYCWGDNGPGQLGDGTNNTRLRPRAVVGPM